MGPSERIAGYATALRALAVRVHRRTAGMPRLPFGIALAVSVTMLLAAIDFAPDHESRLPGPEDPFATVSGDDSVVQVEEREVEVEILESGFGAVVDHRGIERIGFGAVLFNPSECDAHAVTIVVTALDDDGRRSTVEQFLIDYVPLGSRLPIGHVLHERDIDIDDRPRLSVGAATCWFPAGPLTDEELEDLGWFVERPLPRVRILGIEPLVSPVGRRVVFEIESNPDAYTVRTRVDVVFRDSEGAIVGGMPGWGDPFNETVTAAEYRALPPGVSVQHIDLPENRIPEGADLERIEIGPGG